MKTETRVSVPLVPLDVLTVRDEALTMTLEGEGVLASGVVQEAVTESCGGQLREGQVLLVLGYDPYGTLVVSSQATEVSAALSLVGETRRQARVETVWVGVCTDGIDGPMIQV